MIKRGPFFFILTWLFFTNIDNLIFAQSPYHINWPKERAAFISGSVLTSIGAFIQYNVHPLTHQEIEKLSKENVWSFDRFATENWSPSAAKLSDILLITHSLLPVSLLISKNIRDDHNSLGVLYLETMLINYGINSIVKGLTKRTRPFVYNEEAPYNEKLKSNARRSFYSGHTSISFAGAVLTAKLYSDYFPNSNWKEVVWGISLLGASSVGYLRYAAGKHFPSDVIIGAIMGSLAGYLVPYLHEKKSEHAQTLSPFKEAKVYKITFGVWF